MTRATLNPNAPGALGNEFLGVGNTGFAIPGVGLTQYALRFTAQRTGEVDEVAVFLGAGTNVPTLAGARFAGHRLPYIVELIPVDDLSASPPHTSLGMPSTILTSSNLTHYPGGGAVQAGDLGADDTVGVNATSAAGTANMHFATASSFPSNVQVISVALQWVAFSSNLRLSRLGDRNILNNPALWTLVFVGGNSSHHMGEVWIESGDTALWHEVSPLTIQQFDNAVGNRRLVFDVESFNAGFAYNTANMHVDHIPERRLGMGILEVPAGVANQVNKWVRVPLHVPGSTGTPASIVTGEEYYLIIRNCYGDGDFGVASTLDVRTVSDLTDPTPQHFTALDWDFVKPTLSGSLPTGAVGPVLDGLPAVRLINNNAETVDSQPYQRTLGMRVYTGQDAVQNAVPNPSPSTEYRSLRLNIAIGTGDEPSDPLQIFISPSVTGAPVAGPFEVDPDEWNALPTTSNLDEFGHNYKPVLIDFGQGFTFPSPFYVICRSNTFETDPWLVAAMAMSDIGTTGDESYEGSASFTSGEAVDPVTGTLQAVPSTYDADLEFVLFTQAPEVTGLDVSVLTVTGHGATCERVAIVPQGITETFDKANGALGPNLEWRREVFQHHPFAFEVFGNQVRLNVANNQGVVEDLQFPTPNVTSPDVRATLDVVSITSPGTADNWIVDMGFVMRAQQLSETDYRGYAVAVGRSEGIFNPSTIWQLVLFKVNGRADVSVLDIDIAGTVVLPGKLIVDVQGSHITARFDHSSGSTPSLTVQADDGDFTDGLVALGGSVQMDDNNNTGTIVGDNFHVEPLTQTCADCTVPEIPFPRVCWSPSELGADFSFYELQRLEQGQADFETIEVIGAQEPHVTAVGAFEFEDDTLESTVVAPSIIAEGDELLFCHWHALGAPVAWNVTGTGMNPLGTALQLPAVTGVPTGFVTPNRIDFEVSDLDVRALANLSDWTPGAAFDSIPIVGQGTLPNNISWSFNVLANGTLLFVYTTDGTTTVVRASTVATGFTNGTWHWIRFTFDANDGGGNHVVRFFTSLDGLSWTQLGTTVTTAGTVNLFNSTANLLVGSGTGMLTGVSAQIRYVEVRDTIDGPISSVIANPDFHSLLPGTTSFEDDCLRSINLANVWTVTGAASVIDDSEQENATGTGRSSSIMRWQQVPAGATGDREATVSPATLWSAQSVLVRGVDGPPVIEQVSSRTAFEGISTVESIFARRGEWLLALFGTVDGAVVTVNPPSPHSGSWTLITDSGDNTVTSVARVMAWVRPVLNDGEQAIIIPDIEAIPTGDYHLKVVVLSNVAEFLPRCYDDWAVPYGTEVCYRIRQGRMDGSVSDWSTPVCATVAPPGGVDLVFTVPSDPSLNAAYNEAHTRLPTEREYTLLDASQTTYQAVFGRNNQLAFRPTEKLGVRFARSLLVSPLCQNELPCIEVVRPLRDLMEAQVPFIIVRDTCGGRWYASLLVPTVTQFSSPDLPDLWTADVQITELASPIISVPATGAHVMEA